jgi:DNA-binding YbaB/EbfC family protein
MKNINKILKQAQKMQSQLTKAQDDLAKQQLEGTAGGGMVKVMMNGSQELVSIKLSKEVVDPQDVEMLEDLIMAAFKSAQEKVKELSNSTLGQISGGLQIPGL